MMDRINLINDHLSTAAIFEQLAEECSELAQVSLKASRILRNENPTPKTLDEVLPNFEEESADVMLVLEVLCHAGLISETGLESVMMAKTDRWAKRLVAKHIHESAMSEL